MSVQGKNTYSILMADQKTPCGIMVGDNCICLSFTKNIPNKHRDALLASLKFRQFVSTLDLENIEVSLIHVRDIFMFGNNLGFAFLHLSDKQRVITRIIELTPENMLAMGGSKRINGYIAYLHHKGLILPEGDVVATLPNGKTIKLPSGTKFDSA